MTPRRPHEELLGYARDEASGEFICVAPVAELHVYLQGGRIAWATDSRHPFAFAAHLQQTAGIDVDTFRQIVEECRRDRLRLGETLVAWGLTTRAVVRDALAHQIATAIELLATLSEGQTVFLRRAYASYDVDLTFAPDEFARATLPVTPHAAAMPPSPEDDVPDPDALARLLRSSIEDVAWVELMLGDTRIASDPRSPVPRVPPAFIQATVGDGADFVAIRSMRSSLLGLARDRARSIWCRISAGSTFGAVVSAIASLAGIVERPTRSSPPASSSGAWAIGANDTPYTSELKAFVDRMPEALGALLLPGELEEAPIAGTGTPHLDAERGLAVARRRAQGLILEDVLPNDTTEQGLDSIGFSLRTMVSGEPSWWCFGGQLDPGPRGRTLWLFVERTAAQGLGWAYLAAMTRALAGAERA